MQTVSLADSLTLEPAAEILVSVTGAELPRDNLVVRAARVLSRCAPGAPGCAIELLKRIPVAAGLGGGSSDAAATLLGLGRLWGLDLPVEVYVSVAAELGSDIPFFLSGGTALVEGRGERVAPLPAPKTSCYLLVNPGFPVATSSVYAALRSEEWSDGERTHALAAALSPSELAPVGINALQDALFRVSPDAKACFDAVDEVSPEGALVSGSGPTVFARLTDVEAASRARDAIRARGFWAEIAMSTTSLTESIRCD